MVQAKCFTSGVVLAGLLMLNFSIETIAEEMTDSEELDRQFSAGLQALEQDRLRTARESFTNILNVSPSLHRARVELARAYYLSMDYERARRETQQVLDDPNTPPEVRTTLLAFLAQITEDEKQFDQRHRWTPSIYLGAMYDSNVNIGPDRDVIDIGGQLFRLTDESRESSDYAGVINAAIAHTYNPGNTFSLGEHNGFFLWQSQLNGYYRHYSDEEDFHLGVLTARTGPAWVAPRHWRAGIGLQADKIWLGRDGLALFYSLNPNVTWQFGDSWEFSVDAIVTQREYDDAVDADRDGLYSAGSVQLDRFFNQRKFTLQIGAGYSNFDADGERFSYTAPDALLGLIWQAWNNGSVYARAAWRNYDYDGVEPVFNESRDDDEYRYTLGFQHEFRRSFLNQWQLLGSWTRTDNQTNVDIFEYDRDQVSLGLSRSF